MIDSRAEKLSKSRVRIRSTERWKTKEFFLLQGEISIDFTSRSSPRIRIIIVDQRRSRQRNRIWCSDSRKTFFHFVFFSMKFSHECKEANGRWFVVADQWRRLNDVGPNVVEPSNRLDRPCSTMSIVDFLKTNKKENHFSWKQNKSTDRCRNTSANANRREN